MFVKVLLSFCSLSYSHLSKGRVGNDHRVDKRRSAIHLSHLLRYARRHGGLLCLPDQVSAAFLLWDFLSQTFLLVTTTRINPTKQLHQSTEVFYLYFLRGFPPHVQYNSWAHPQVPQSGNENV